MKKFVCLTSVFFLLSLINAQNCKPNIDIKVNICGSKYLADSTNSECPICNDCYSGLVPTDSSFKIISFVITASGVGFEDYIDEATNTGARFHEGHVLAILAKLRVGSTVAFTCIKARYVNGFVYILKPLEITLR